MASVFVVVVVVVLGFCCCCFWGRLPVFMLIGWRVANNHAICSWTKLGRWHGASGVKRNVGEGCFVCLTWLYGLIDRTPISLTNPYAGCGRPYYWAFWLGSLRSDSEATSPRGTVLTDYVELFSIYECELKDVLHSCIILCDTSKASENLTFVLKQGLILSSDFVELSSLSVVWVTWRSKTL